MAKLTTVFLLLLVATNAIVLARFGFGAAMGSPRLVPSTSRNLSPEELEILKTYLGLEKRGKIYSFDATKIHSFSSVAYVRTKTTENFSGNCCIREKIDRGHPSRLRETKDVKIKVFSSVPGTILCEIKPFEYI